jgi:hypothetical protein
MNAPLVIGKDLHPANVVFSVVGKTRNGWLHCRIHSTQSGKPLEAGSVFKFRAGDMVPFGPARN